MRIMYLNMLKGLDEPPHWDVVVWLILVALGPEFLSLDPRLSVRPHVEVWDSRRLTNLLRPSMSYLVRAFHLAYALKMFWKEMEKRRGASYRNVAEVAWGGFLWQTNLAVQRTVPRPRTADLVMAARTFWRGSWNRSTWGKGCRRSPLRQLLTEWCHVALETVITCG
jgi:hypothetical protein